VPGEPAHYAADRGLQPDGRPRPPRQSGVLPRRRRARPGHGRGPDLDLAAGAAALCVLAGIAAADAACCSALGQRARGQSHQEAVGLVKAVEPHGLQLAKDLKRLLDRKGNAHYGTISIGANDARDMITWARRMTDNATDVLAR
jgi:hypothetical protein